MSVVWNVGGNVFNGKIVNKGNGTMVMGNQYNNPGNDAGRPPQPAASGNNGGGGGDQQGPAPPPSEAEFLVRIRNELSARPEYNKAVTVFYAHDTDEKNDVVEEMISKMGKMGIKVRSDRTDPANPGLVALTQERVNKADIIIVVCSKQLVEKCNAPPSPGQPVVKTEMEAVTERYDKNGGKVDFLVPVVHPLEDAGFSGPSFLPPFAPFSSKDVVFVDLRKARWTKKFYKMVGMRVLELRENSLDHAWFFGPLKEVQS
jgi:hypothetical protein